MRTLDTTAPRFDAVTPRLPVLNVEELLAFYINGLGFELGWKWGEPVTHANVCRNAVSIDLISVPWGREGTAMAYVQMHGVDTYHAELRGRGVNVSEVDDRPYGMRDFEVVDPCGNRIAFGQPLSV
jgi:catechol 2,3-dioxygenase-like lactoylglutathione lyase family enzyme